MSQAIDRMNILIQAMLEYSRLGRNILLTRVNLNRLLNDVLMDMQSVIQSSNAMVSFSELPELNVNELEIRQLFQNLISNAIKFRRDQIKPEIYIRADRQNGKWQFVIKDNGIGIDLKYRQRIFQIFQRLHPKEKYDGYGIGLANCKKIVELHGGEIWVDSEPGKGSSFYFTIS